MTLLETFCDVMFTLRLAVDFGIGRTVFRVFAYTSLPPTCGKSTVLSIIFLVQTINALVYYIATSSDICVVSDGVLYVNGVYERNLTRLENEAVRAYMKEYNNYTAQLEKYDNSPPRPEDASMRPPIPPTTPAFCNNRTVYYLKGCMITDNMLFINGQYIRDISKEEAKRLDTFEKQYHKYMDYLEQAYSQYEYDYYDEDAWILSAISQDPTMAPVSPPEDPQICIEL